jgi:hypothetical protein
MDTKVSHVIERDLFVPIKDLEGLGDRCAVDDAGRPIIRRRRR